LRIAIKEDNLKILYLISQYGINFSKIISASFLPLHYALHNGNLLSLKFLLSLPGSNINQAEARNQQTPLIIASACGGDLSFLIIY
jgi:hypothetical protein